MQFRGIYSILGAAAFCGSVTRTVSVAMIVLELNGHLSHACPLMVCVLSSYAISEWIKPESFFEALADMTGLLKRRDGKGHIIVKDVLAQRDDYRIVDIDFLSLNDSSETDLIEAAKFHTDPVNIKRLRYIPVVDNSTTMNLLYIIKVADLK